MTDTRCTETVPEALTGALSGGKPPVCHRDKGHTGKHRAYRGKRGVGKTSWEWKTQPKPEYRPTYDGFGAPISSPQPIQTSRMVRNHICGCRGLVHGCDYLRGLVR
jgi:hypothetical protein